VIRQNDECGDEQLRVFHRVTSLRRRPWPRGRARDLRRARSGAGAGGSCGNL